MNVEIKLISFIWNITACVAPKYTIDFIKPASLQLVYTLQKF